MAFIRNNLPGWLNGIHLAVRGTGLARPSAFFPAAQPVKDAKSGDKTKCRAQGTQVFAVELAIERRDHQQPDGVK